MSAAYAKANLDQAMVALDAGIEAHVAALVAARAAALDTDYIDALTLKVQKITEALALSTVA